MKKLFSTSNNRFAGALVAAGLVLAGAAVAFDTNSKDKPEHAAINVPMDESAVGRDTLPHGSYASVVKKVTPAVVKILTTTRINDSEQQQQMPGFNDPFWRHFFGDQFGQMMPKGGPEIQHGLGSGVIITKDGFILTNNHVVDGSKEVKVTLQDGREFTAKVIGRDPKSDIAVVKIDANDLPTVPLADSSKVEVGDVVLAIGNPFGVGQTVTSGIVSATDRGNLGIEEPGAYEDFIQTDAAINPGNSGGALVDIEGRLIGINTAILSRSGGFQGVGFAVPANLARTVMESLVEYGHVTRGYMGVSIQTITPDLASQFNLKDTKGALVGDVVPNGPADRAGLKSGDVIEQFNGRTVTDSRQLQLEVAEMKPGATVPVEIVRDGSRKTLDVTLKQLPGKENLAENNENNNTDTGTLNGVEVTDLNQDARDQFHVPQNVKGAVITQVDPGSASAEAGLKPGDVIQEINHHAVADADQAVKLTENSGNKHTLVRVWDNGGSHYVVVDESSSAG